jgi:uncharacterized damage-inducible protein DinB
MPEGFADVTLHHPHFRNVRMRGAWFEDTTIDGDVDGLVVNGIAIGPLVDAELDRRHPERPKFRPTSAEGFGAAWDLNERLWATTVDRARSLPHDLLHESVDGEWSFVQTLRHLAFASETWVGRVVSGDPHPWHPLSLPWDTAPTVEGMPHDRDARPPFEEALALRHDAMRLVRRVLDDLDDQRLGEKTEPCIGPGWPAEGETFEVRECLLMVLNEEWWHRQFAERDLAVLEGRSTAR